MDAAAPSSSRPVQIRNHSQTPFELVTSCHVDGDGAPCAKSKGSPFVLEIGGTDDGAAVRRKSKPLEGTTFLDNRVEVPADVWAKIQGDTVIAGLLEDGTLEAIGA